VECVRRRQGRNQKFVRVNLNPSGTAQVVESIAESPRAESIEELFQALESPLLAYAHRLAPSGDMAEDFVQEAFVRLHAQFNSVQAPRRWLFRTVHNLALNYRRDEAKIVPMTPALETDENRPLGALAVDSQLLPDEQLVFWEGIGLVRLHIQNLATRDREVLMLKFHEDLSYQQISERTGLSVGHVGYLLHHALKSLAVDLTKAGLAP